MPEKEPFRCICCEQLIYNLEPDESGNMVPAPGAPHPWSVKVPNTAGYPTAEVLTPLCKTCCDLVDAVSASKWMRQAHEEWLAELEKDRQRNEHYKKD